MDTWFIVLNPAAGGGKVKKTWPLIEAELNKLGIDFSANFTIAPGHATSMVREAINAGFRKFIAVGGDGTNHEAINGLMSQKIIDPKALTYALLPVGTGNDWIRTHQIPVNWRKWLPQIFHTTSRLHDIGVLAFQGQEGLENRYFINIAGFCYDAFVVRAMSLITPRPKGKLAYLWWVIRCLFQYQPGPCRIDFNGQKVEQKCYTINAGICKYSGGGMQFVPQALPDDGLIGLTIAGEVSKWNVIKSTPKFFSGKIANHPQIKLYQSTEIEIKPLGDDKIYVEADGEFLGEAPVKIRILPSALSIILPAKT
jgi:YegS/Rv2252/BmrU family lipid kinase